MLFRSNPNLNPTLNQNIDNSLNQSLGNLNVSTNLESNLNPNLNPTLNFQEGNVNNFGLDKEMKKVSEINKSISQTQQDQKQTEASNDKLIRETQKAGLSKINSQIDSNTTNTQKTNNTIQEKNIKKRTTLEVLDDRIRLFLENMGIIKKRPRPEEMKGEPNPTIPKNTQTPTTQQTQKTEDKSGGIQKVDSTQKTEILDTNTTNTTNIQKDTNTKKDLNGKVSPKSNIQTLTSPDLESNTKPENIPLNSGKKADYSGTIPKDTTPEKKIPDVIPESQILSSPQYSPENQGSVSTTQSPPKSTINEGALDAQARSMAHQTTQPEQKPDVQHTHSENNQVFKEIIPELLSS